MNDVASSPKQFGQQGKDLADTAANKVHGGIQSTQHAANKALDKASEKVDEVKGNVAPVLDKLSDQAQELIQKGRAVFKDTSKTVREKATQVSDLAVDYTKDEPIKAMLIAAAAGAFLMELVTMMARSRD